MSFFRSGTGHGHNSPSCSGPGESSRETGSRSSSAAHHESLPRLYRTGVNHRGPFPLIAFLRSSHHPVRLCGCPFRLSHAQVTWRPSAATMTLLRRPLTCGSFSCRTQPAGRRDHRDVERLACCCRAQHRDACPKHRGCSVNAREGQRCSPR